MEPVQILHPDLVVHVMKGTQVLNVINVRTLNFFCHFNVKIYYMNNELCMFCIVLVYTGTNRIGLLMKQTVFLNRSHLSANNV